VTVCSRCGQENPDGFRFCGACAAPLAALQAARETRRTVTAVFSDVVGSTPLGERLDPEVLRSVMRSYFEVMREVVEAHGGTVSKFIGDAVVGVFGVPRLHEDDPLRAVRAAVEMQARLEDLNASLGAEWDVALETRTGIATGEVVVGADDEAVLGDVMNTAARLEAAAEPGGILVSDETWALVADAVSGEAADLVVKGKVAPVRAWRLAAIDQRAAGHERRLDRPLIGRNRELRVLRDALERAIADRYWQLVTIVGEPGIGKSRLVTEFETLLDREEAQVTRLRGRCLAYGDGIGFWPLAEALKGYLGIDESSSEEDVRGRLTACVEGMQDAPWLRARLGPLVGLAGEAAERDEVFTAWQRFFDEVAARNPLVVVFEDLHWADPAVLAFIQYLAEWSTGVPMLVVCTARPELYEAHPAWAGGVANATTLALRPLSGDDTRRLVRALLAEFVASRDATAALVEQSGGNPLFAEEYARLLAERATDATAGTLIPETLRAVIGARIDALPVERRALLHDAAVVGKVFWTGALTAISGRDRARVHGELHALARRELVRRSRASTLPGDEEYSFWHDLVHEVAYNQIPRADRGEAHRRTAEWIETAAGDRVADRAELLAHHYTAALTLARQSARGDQEQLRKAALRHLTTAARGAMGLDADHATRLTRQGLDLAGADDHERAELLCLLGTSRFFAGQLDEARVLLADARAAADAAGDLATLGEAFFQATEVAYVSGDGQGFDRLADDGIAGLTRAQASGWFARLLANVGFVRMTHNAHAESRELLEHSLEIGQAVGDTLAVATALDVRGLLRTTRGEPEGFADLEASLAMFVERGSPYVTMAMMHLGSAQSMWNNPAAAAPTLAEAIDHATRTGNTTYAAYARSLEIIRLSDSGAWDELVVAADGLLAWAESRHSLLHVVWVAPYKARVLALQGATQSARNAMVGVVEQARRAVDLYPLVAAIVAASLIECLDGNVDQARSLAKQFGPTLTYDSLPVAEVCRVLVACQATRHARDLTAQSTIGSPWFLSHATGGKAVVAEADGDLASAARLYEDAAILWRTHGNPYELAHALAGQARCITALDRLANAGPLADEAAQIFGRLGVHERVLARLRPHVCEESSS
jgi:class 3 adenylate cyclase